MRRLLKKYLLPNNYGWNIRWAAALIGILVLHGLKAQVINYVSNPGFETILPTATLSAFSAAKNWAAIDSFKASYVVMNEVLGNAPNCATGFQRPRTGESFILSQFYCATSTCSASTRWYPRNRLKQVLKQNTTYCAKYFVVSTNNCVVGSNSFGAYFGSSIVDTISHCIVPLTYLNPQVQYQGGIITDTLNWMAITGTFVANGTEKYMVLGNFKSNAATNTMVLNPTYLPTMTNDIYIDDVSLIELDLPASAGTDTFVVPGDSVFLGREPDVGINEACMWYRLPNTTTAIDTVAGLWVKPVVTTTYVVRQEICGNVKWDTVVVYQSALGIQSSKFQVQNIAVYPVPADEVLNVKLEMLNDQSDPSFEMLIYNSLGQIVREEEISFKEKSVKINTKEFSEGVYLLQIKNGAMQTVSKRFVISQR